MNITTDNGQVHGLPPSETYVAIGILMVIVMALGCIQNSSLLFVFGRNQQLFTPNNIFVVGLSISDLGQSVLGMPFVVVSCFEESWPFGRVGCVYYGFVTTFLAISQITILTMIAVERYIVIVLTNRLFSVSRVTAVYTIIGCYGHGLVWSILPIFGWSGYELEAINISCSIRWRSKMLTDTSYSISLTAFGLVIPVCIIVFCYRGVFTMLQRESGIQKSKGSHVLVPGSRKMVPKLEKRVAVTMLLLIGCFVISWTPYAVVSLWAALGNPLDITPMTSGIPAIFAKTSIIWNPIIYVFRNYDFRKAYMRLFSRLKQRLCKRIFKQKKMSQKDASISSQRSSRSYGSSIMKTRDSFISKRVSKIFQSRTYKLKLLDEENNEQSSECVDIKRTQEKQLNLEEADSTKQKLKYRSFNNKSEKRSRLKSVDSEQCFEEESSATDKQNACRIAYQRCNSEDSSSQQETTEMDTFEHQTSRQSRDTSDQENRVTSVYVQNVDLAKKHNQKSPEFRTVAAQTDSDHQTFAQIHSTSSCNISESNASKGLHPVHSVLDRHRFHSIAHSDTDFSEISNHHYRTPLLRPSFPCSMDSDEDEDATIVIEEKHILELPYHNDNWFPENTRQRNCLEPNVQEHISLVYNKGNYVRLEDNDHSILRYNQYRYRHGRHAGAPETLNGGAVKVFRNFDSVLNDLCYREKQLKETKL